MSDSVRSHRRQPTTCVSYWYFKNWGIKDSALLEKLGGFSEAESLYGKDHLRIGQVVVVVLQSLSHIWLFVTPWTAAHQIPLSSTISQSSFKFMSTESVMLSNHLILCRPLLFLPSIFPSTRVFSNESALHFRWPTFKLDRLSNPPRTQHSQVCSPYFQLVRVTHLRLLSGLWSHLNVWPLSFFFSVQSFSSILGSRMECCIFWKRERKNLPIQILSLGTYY